MRKLLLSVLTAVFALTANAQAFTADGDFVVTPGLFTCDHETTVLERKYSYDEIGNEEEGYIYNYHYKYTFLNGMSEGTTYEFNGNNAPIGLYYYDFDNWASIANSIGKICFTQNLFDDDEEWEWIVRDRETNEYYVYSKSGMKQKIWGGDGNVYIYKINGQNYIYYNEYSTKTSYLWLIDKTSSSLKAMPADASVSRMVHDLNGRRLNGMQKGINIVTDSENGTRKVLKR